MKRSTSLVTTSAAALAMMAVALPGYAGGGDEDGPEKRGGSVGSSRNGQIVFRRYFDAD
jgi:hypothetical protein